MEPVMLGRREALRRDPQTGAPVLIALPQRVALMEVEADRMFTVLGGLSVAELQAAHAQLVVATAPATAKMRRLVEALIAVRALMGGEGSR